VTWSAEVADTFGPVVMEGVAPRVDVPASEWVASAERARDRLGCDYFDFLTVAEEPEGPFLVVCHLVDVTPGSARGVLLRCRLAVDAPVVSTLSGVFAGAAWHEREMHEMYGVTFIGGDDRPLLLSEGMPDHPLRKDDLLPARGARTWPGAKEPGEAGAAPSRRRLRPPGVPDGGGGRA
jgi:NADH:ubiquinone oxidoreductase subunit C